MLVAGLTGGIGSGKSTFAALLSEHGARLVDADAIGRRALDPGKPAWHSVVDTFGDGVLGSGMNIDRSRLAAIVFEDDQKLAALNAIVHPVIMGRIAEELETLRPTTEIVVLDAALIIETGLDAILDLLIVITTTPKLRESRLQHERGMTLDDIRARMGAQRPTEELVARADIHVKNDGTLEKLSAEAQRVWRELVARRDAV
ncbi:MAG TPA: dephospho-CoA kinase [Actinomycetota bacterium]|nr:dephospho-CoA kinase [Actinomycetota bacterium]